MRATDPNVTGGCQAEVGVACSMAAGAFAACMGASPEVVLQAAEIGIEHNLGLTCDPIDGLVQVPCIERNSLGAVKAITAAQLAMATDAVHSVSLDEAIEAMRLTAADMSIKYKETSLSVCLITPETGTSTDVLIGSRCMYLLLTRMNDLRLHRLPLKFLLRPPHGKYPSTTTRSF